MSQTLQFILLILKIFTLLVILSVESFRYSEAMVYKNYKRDCERSEQELLTIFNDTVEAEVEKQIQEEVKIRGTVIETSDNTNLSF